MFSNGLRFFFFILFLFFIYLFIFILFYFFFFFAPGTSLILSKEVFLDFHNLNLACT